MPPQLEELPLFPLHTVLFPHANLRLHIYEERYREMIRMCLRESRPFGVVLIRSGSESGPLADPYLVGTAARIVQAETYEDGRMDIHVMGERRFRIRELDDRSNSFLVGRVEPVVEEAISSSPEIEALIAHAREDFEVLIRRFFERERIAVDRVKFPDDPVELSFSIANHLAIENLEKQRLLETTDTVERLADLAPILEVHIREISPHTECYRMTSQDLREWISPN
ncbi:MAG TPA: LON peptidase substrate-binding domain-containing protein [Fimbriimonas sp.]|nr:LON peptidase substrate-binding domain-containing protein [Fimbriimonas sp.]